MYILQKLAIVFLVAVLVGPAHAERLAHAVDLELILAVDVSRSMNGERLQLQRDGYVAAFRDPGIAKAIGMGPQGRIAVTYVEWSGTDNQAVLLPWRVIASHADALQLAADLADKPTHRTHRTSISAMFNRAMELFDQSPYAGLRRVIDVSGDGPNNSGLPIIVARDALLARGVVINGLPIAAKPDALPGFYDPIDLDAYYRDCVIGGPGAFRIAAASMRNFAKAIRMKLILEIANLEPPRTRPGLQRAGYFSAPATRPRADCLAGHNSDRRTSPLRRSTR